MHSRPDRQTLSRLLAGTGVTLLQSKLRLEHTAFIWTAFALIHVLLLLGFGYLLSHLDPVPP